MESKMDQYLPEMLALYHREDFTAVTGRSDNRSKDSSFIHLQRRLALRTFCLREYILTPFMIHLLHSRVRCELVRLYRAYCYFFRPYYDKPGDREGVKELLVKEGIFGGE